MKILITGGAGYIGSRLVPFLAEHGYQITVIDKFDVGCNLDHHPNVNVLNLDLFDTNEGHYRGHDVVIHLAGLSNDPMANFNPSDNFIQNLAGTSLVAYLSRKAGVTKFFCAGSCSVYGMTKQTILDESVIPESEFPYAISKIQSEHALLQLARNDFQVVILRQATVFGWAPRMRTDLVVNTMVKNAITDGTIFVNDPFLSRPLIHVDDLCEVYYRLITSKHELPSILNVATDNYTIKEIAECVHQTLVPYLPNLLIVNRNLPDPRSYRVSTDLLLKSIGTWDPITIEQAVTALINYMPITDLESWNDTRWLNIELYKTRLEKEKACKKY